MNFINNTKKIKKINLNDRTDWASVIRLTDDIKEIYLSDSERSGHIFGMRTTRFGKTRLIEQDLRK